MVKPLSPADIPAAKRAIIPDEVIEAVNELLALYYDGARAVLKIGVVRDTITSKLIQAGKAAPAANGWSATGYLDFEPIFRDAGWKVIFDKPAYCETYEAFWEFTRN